MEQINPSSYFRNIKINLQDILLFTLSIGLILGIVGVVVGVALGMGALLPHG